MAFDPEEACNPSLPWEKDFTGLAFCYGKNADKMLALYEERARIKERLSRAKDKASLFTWRAKKLDFKLYRLEKKIGKLEERFAL